MRLVRLTTADFETAGIAEMPDYPPEPCGIALDWPETKSRKAIKEYLAWGHASNNNCTKNEAVRKIRKAWYQNTPLFHNSSFDLIIAFEHLDLEIPEHYHDTLYLAHLYDPREENLSLKPLSEKYCGDESVERDVLQEWILANVPGAHNARTSKTQDPMMYWAALINKAPGDLVGKYAIGDVRKTKKVFDHHYPYIRDNGMLEAYHRELYLMPSVWDMENTGVRTNLKRLQQDAPKREAVFNKIDQRVRRILKVGKDMNLDSPDELADAMEHAGIVEEWIATQGGKRSTSMAALREVVLHKNFLALWQMRSMLKKIVTTYDRPWLEMATKNDGWIYPRYNQVRETDERNRKVIGTRTGRFSSSKPNFQNIPKRVNKELKALFDKMYPDMPYPFMRQYLIPDTPDHVFIDRDYSQQEFRLLAEFAGGALKEAYMKNPKLDMHTQAQQMIKEMVNLDLQRVHVKTVGFGLIYGMGIELLAGNMELLPEEAKRIKRAYLQAIPGIKILSNHLEDIARGDEPIVTWGGRQYFVEEPTYVKKFDKVMEFYYKLLNYLIQGSAADVTKEAFIRIEDACQRSRMVMTVHDQFTRSVLKKYYKSEMRHMRLAMESIETDIPMLSDGQWSAKSWGNLIAFED